MLLLFALTILTFGCAENSEDTIPDPVVPELNIDDQKSETDAETKKTKSTTRVRRG